MKKIPATRLKDIKIEWLQNKTEAPFMQGMAINKLRSVYKGSKRYGYMLLNGNEGIGEEGCYYLLELKTNINGDIQKALVAFKENGDNIAGHTIFTNSDKYFAMIEASEVSDEDLEAAADFIDKIKPE